MKKIILLGSIFIAVIILFYPVFFTYFSQDDFFHFKVSLKFDNLVQAFGFYPFSERGIAFYRPIFREVLFHIFFGLFGLNHYPFRVFQFALFFLNIFLAFKLVDKIFNDRKLAAFVSFFFAISAAQISPLYYLAGGIQVIGATTFILLTLILTIKYLQTDNIKYLVVTFITFILALCSHELASILTVLISALFFVYLPFKKALKKVWVTLPFFITFFSYLYLEVTKIGFSTAEKQYQAVFSLKGALNSYMWYTGWALGLPEMLIDFVFPGFKLNPSLMRYWGSYYLVIFTSFFIGLILILSGVLFLIAKKRESILNKKFLFLMFWYIVGLVPVILLPLHKSSQYLETSLVAFWTIIGLICFPLVKPCLPAGRWEAKLGKIYLAVLVVTLFMLSSTSILLERTTYPAAQRGVIAQKLIRQIASKYPSLPKGAILYIQNDPSYPFVADEWGSSSKQAAFILNNSDALQLVYKDPSLKVYYEDLGGLQMVTKEAKVYNITARVYD